MAYPATGFFPVSMKRVPIVDITNLIVDGPSFEKNLGLTSLIVLMYLNSKCEIKIVQCKSRFVVDICFGWTFF